MTQCATLAHPWFTPYKLQLHQALSVDDKQVHANFCTEMQERFEVDDFTERLIFSNEATFHVSGKVHRNNVRIWGTENPHVIFEYVRDSSKVKVFCAISKMKVYGPFFFTECTIIYLRHAGELADVTDE